MKIKLYFPRRDEFGRIISSEILPEGYVEADKFDAEYCWHLCNWFHWSDKKPKNLHSRIDSCGHGLIVYDKENNEYWLALSGGWLRGTYKEILDYVRRKVNDPMSFWLKEDM